MLQLTIAPNVCESVYWSDLVAVNLTLYVPEVHVEGIYDTVTSKTQHSTSSTSPLCGLKESMTPCANEY
jgi:hypothetical protein